MNRTPRNLGYRMPAEWEPHAATWLSWPHKEESWPGKFEPVPGVFAEIIRHLCPGEIVHINVNDAAMETAVRNLLADRLVPAGNVRFHRIPTNDAWCRDYGPTFLVRTYDGKRHLAAVDWRFNAWGGKYPPYDFDDDVPVRAAHELGIPCFRSELVMEGGSFDVNGAGLLLTTEACLLNPNRNPRFTKGQIEDHLGEYLGVQHILWLGDGIAGDDTDGHVDDLARFVDARTIVTVVEEDPVEENYHALRDNMQRLQRMHDQAGRPLQIVTLPMPPPAFYEGQRLPCSYANFYIANETVLVPTFSADTDSVAVATIQNLFPTRRVVGIEAADLVWGLGTFHCVTQQQPEGESGYAGWESILEDAGRV